VDRIRAAGNGQVPIVAWFAWQLLYSFLNSKNIKTELIFG
jgi:hypothetical protein